MKIFDPKIVFIRMIKITTFLLVLFMLPFCKTAKNKSTKQTTENQKKNESLLYRYEKTPCYGSCPVYVAEIHKDGKVAYTGKHFVKTIGMSEFYLPKSVINNIAAEVEKMNFMNLKDEYKTGVTDVPSTILTVYKNGQSKTVKHEEGGPAELAALLKYMHQEIERAAYGEEKREIPRFAEPEKRNDKMEQ